MAVEIEATSRAPATARRMAEAARAFLATLNEAQRKAATFPLFGDERYKWNYRPLENMPRNGLWLIAMTAEQRRAALALLESGTSARGNDRSIRIMGRETTLREHERADGMVSMLIRDPELYWWSVFGEPGDHEPWGWRVSGHHLGLHFTIVGGDLVSATPFFLGANPAESRLPPNIGDRILPDEEDMARALVGSLDTPRKAQAVISPIAPRDILTDVNRRVWPGVIPRGLRMGEMAEPQRRGLSDLIRVYMGRASDEIANVAWAKAERAGLDGVTFAWSGPEARGAGHYYAISGPTFMIEYDNVQNNGNHIHSVWREWDGDWGEDVLAAHYREANGHHHGH
ncbi:MAG: DUF3500 domain-containing protein [Chloroflexota bacterium]|nr:MAG: DUF3500 domain-containing protein [Chloroflexota bacterium]